jgi:hypothetical protein
MQPPPQALLLLQRQRQRLVALPALLLLALLAAVAAPAARAAGVANIQSIHGCDCIGVCDRGNAGPHNTPTCYVNVSSCEFFFGFSGEGSGLRNTCLRALRQVDVRARKRTQSSLTPPKKHHPSGNYLVGRQKAPMTGRTGKNTTAPFDKFAVPYEEIEFPALADGTKIASAVRVWDYCQDPTWVPRASNITTLGGCKCLEVYQSAFGLLSNVSCLGTETDRPFCYVKKGSCPKGFQPQTSDYYAGSAYALYDYCQPYTQAADPRKSPRTLSGCLCLDKYLFYDQVVNGGTCVTGQRQFPGRLRCFVDPKTCDPKLMAKNGGPYPSVLYRDMYVDLCD